MPDSAAPTPAPTPAEAIARACAYLAAMEARDLDRAASFLSDGARLVFPGGRVLDGVDAIVANSGGRYRRVAKRIERREAWGEPGGLRVLIAGTLHGAWRDGTPFEGIRFIDLFAFQGDRIVSQEVWNDVGERCLAEGRALEGRALA